METNNKPTNGHNPTHELVAQLGLQREPGASYYVKSDGEVWRRRSGKGGVRELVTQVPGFARATGFLYFIDASGDLRRVAMARGRGRPGPRRPVPGSRRDRREKAAAAKARPAAAKRPERAAVVPTPPLGAGDALRTIAEALGMAGAALADAARVLRDEADDADFDGMTVDEVKDLLKAYRRQLRNLDRGNKEN